MKRIVISLSAVIFIIANVGLSQDIINETGKDGKFIVRDAEQKEQLRVEDGNVSITGELKIETMAEGNDTDAMVVWDGNDKKLKVVQRVFSKLSPLSEPLDTGIGHSIIRGNSLGEDNNEISLSVQGTAATWNQFDTDYGYIKLGPANADWAHIYTDKDNFIFNKPLYSLNGSFSAYSNYNLHLQTNGTNRLTILASNGNVGISTTSPVAKLDIYTGTNTNGILVREDTDNSITHNFYVDGGDNGQLILYANGQVAKVSLNTGGSSYFNGGNVGIGTTSPDEKLHIAGNMRLNGGFEDKDGDKGTSGQILSSTGTLTNWIDAPSGGADNLGNHIATQNIRLNSKWLSGDGDNEGIYVNSSGKVGIGTASPSAKLDIYTGTNTNGILVREDTDNSITHNFYVDGGDNGQLILYANGQVAKVSLNTGGSSYFNGGNVGIGTATPQGKLDIISTDGALIVPRMTTTQRGNLPTVNGSIIYNTTTNAFNFYENSSWVTK